jgi:hypothetical protein
VLLASLADPNRPAPTVILQFWSEASVDEELRAVLTEQVGRLCVSAQHALGPWAEAQTAAVGSTGGGAGSDGAGDDGAGDDGASARLALRTAQTCLTMTQGFLANRCLFGWLDAGEFLETASRAFEQA